MSVMVSLGNPRTMEEIKVRAVTDWVFTEMIAEEDNVGDGIITT